VKLYIDQLRVSNEIPHNSLNQLKPPHLLTSRSYESIPTLIVSYIAAKRCDAWRNLWKFLFRRRNLAPSTAGIRKVLVWRVVYIKMRNMNQA